MVFGTISAASAVRASERIRSTMERKPFERCGVRCSRKPMPSNNLTASVFRISFDALARIDSEQDCDQSAHDMGIAVAGKGQHWAARAVWAHSGVEPDLARAALNLVGIAMRRLRQRRQFAPQLNQIAIAIVPIVQDRKIVEDLVNVSHCVQARTLVTRVGFYIESNAAQVDISAGR